MLELFILNEDNYPIPNPEILTISCFKKIVDRSNKKDNLGIKELAYIYWEASYQSPFKEEVIEELKLEKIKKDVDLSEIWFPDELVLEGVQKYKDLQRTPSMRFLETAEKALENLRTYLDETDLQKTIESGTRKGELVNDVKKYGDMFTSMPTKIKAYQEMKGLVDAEIEQKRTSKGGRDLGRYADKKK